MGTLAGKLTAPDCPHIDKIEGFSLEIEQHQKSLAPWHEQIEAKSNEIKIATQQLEDLRGKSAQIQEDIERIEQEIDQDRAAASEQAKELKALKANRAELVKRVEQAERQLESEKTVETKYRTVLSSAREKSIEAKASQQASQSKGQTLASILKLKEQGRLPGFHVRSASRALSPLCTSRRAASLTEHRLAGTPRRPRSYR